MFWPWPIWFQVAVLILGSFRLTRLVGWDDLPPVARARAWLLGARPNGTYRRPLLAHFVHCPFCVGFWIGLAVIVSWWLWTPVVIILAPFALNTIVGLTAKNLDA